ncbi:xanthine dehydrogenase family protein subunit M [Streptacidiphilus pinicola]|uniref:Xanthine dehydrogenase family protein subunit M n=1 Tax=Streptacidiphilus pinicola TaxID=2219663 RepID=A0A2X0I8C6_9ACTN|nr:xanthine dehydrogenase family protein subunit M [Streptacidiphilus pinicola]RAG81192.1 xanthine dehydrogenase family protein subunit M [Streptacidiphilus pinicola]
MIPAKFDYARPQSAEEAVRVLADAGPEAKVLAGGQSLLPILRLRLSFPELLVDVGALGALRGVREEGQELAVGALTTHHDMVHDPLVRAHAGLLARAAATIADPAVRHRGTLGGSLAHADPAGDLPAVCLAMDATMVALGPQGYRTIPAAEFFVDYLQTALRPDELLTEIRFPVLDGWGYHYEKFHRTAQAWAVVGVAAAVRRERNGGGIAEARVGLVNMGARPLRAHLTETALAGAEPTRETIGRAATMAAEGAHPPTDLSGSAEYREHLARVLTRRALLAAAGAA